MASTPKKQEILAIREQRALLHGVNLRNNANVVSPASFQARKDYTITQFENGAYLKDPDRKNGAPANPMTDPAAMEGMMGMMKGNMTMMIPQTLIMSWINAFFSGFVISELTLLIVKEEYWWYLVRLPFPLTIKFKSMLQSGVGTRDMDPQWMSSISWYVLCIFGLQSVFNYLLGSDNCKWYVGQQSSPWLC